MRPRDVTARIEIAITWRARAPSRLPRWLGRAAILRVRDLPRSLTYYLKRLGLEIARRWSEVGNSFQTGHPTFACVRRGACSIFLAVRDLDGNRIRVACPLR